MKKFYFKYFKDFNNLCKFDKFIFKKLEILTNLVIDLKKNKKKIIIVGNGGSSAIASHFSVDMTKNAGVRTVNFNEYDLITCFANDFGYENWVSKSLDFYLDPGDILILISSSGRSKNIINAAKVGKKLNAKSIITFSGFKKNNQLGKFGDLNFWVNSKNYNHVETAHQLILLALVDRMIFMK
jgi:D-sedoheptulose 7-phosphate isomerase